MYVHGYIDRYYQGSKNSKGPLYRSKPRPLFDQLVTVATSWILLPMAPVNILGLPRICAGCAVFSPTKIQQPGSGRRSGGGTLMRNGFRDRSRRTTADESIHKRSFHMCTLVRFVQKTF